jgi:hypothetical protein
LRLSLNSSRVGRGGCANTDVTANKKTRISFVLNTVEV